MTDPTRISVAQEGERAFRVEIQGSDVSTTHAVEVPEGLAEELGWGQAREADLVQASFAFLLEREPPTSILRHFKLDVIGSYFPEYQSEMRQRSRSER